MSDRSKMPGSGSASPANGEVISGKELSDDELVPEDLGLSPAWRQELLRRIRAYHQNPASAIPWVEVVRMIEQKVRSA